MGYLNLSFSFAKLVAFRIIHKTYVLSRSAYWMLTGTGSLVTRSKEPENYDWSVHVQNVFYKYTFDVILDECDPHNFMTTHGGFIHPEEVLKDQYTLYSVHLDEAVFVEVPAGIDVCASGVGSFTKETQFNHCKRLLIMPIASLHRLADQLGGPHKPIIFLGITTRCGSTLLVQIFEKTGRVRCFSEPQQINSLAMFLEKRVLPEDELEKMVRSGMRLLLKPVQQQDITHYHIKLQTGSTVVLPCMKKLFPDSVHLFSYREGMAVARSLTLAAEAMPMYKFMLTLGRISKTFTVLVMEQTGMPLKALDVRVKDPVLFSFIHWADQCGKYLKLRKEGLDIWAIKYEDLCAHPENTVREIFRYCGLPLELVPLGLQAMAVDSQQNSMLSMKNVRRNPLPVMAADCQVDADASCDYWGLPRHPHPCVLEGTLTRE